MLFWSVCYLLPSAQTVLNSSPRYKKCVLFLATTQSNMFDVYCLCILDFSRNKGQDESWNGLKFHDGIPCSENYVGLESCEVCVGL